MRTTSLSPPIGPVWSHSGRSCSILATQGWRCQVGPGPVVPRSNEDSEPHVGRDLGVCALRRSGLRCPHRPAERSRGTYAIAVCSCHAHRVAPRLRGRSTDHSGRRIDRQSQREIACRITYRSSVKRTCSDRQRNRAYASGTDLRSWSSQLYWVMHFPVERHLGVTAVRISRGNDHMDPARLGRSTGDETTRRIYRDARRKPGR